MTHCNSFARAMPLLMLGLIAGWGGCQRDDGLYQVTGTVTFEDQPVPAGFVFFDPDTARQNRGPQGYSLIEDGKFTTRGKFAKGVVGGPHRIRIGGFNGQNISETQMYGDRLFPEYTELKDLPREDCQLEFNIPSPDR